MGEGKLPVLLNCGEAKVLAAEEEQRVEEDDGGVRPQLFTVPQELLLHTGIDETCRGEERAVFKSGQPELIQRRKTSPDDSPLATAAGLKPFRILLILTENFLKMGSLNMFSK